MRSSFGDWKGIVVRAGKQFREHNGTLLAAALAYSSFFAIPAVLLVATGLFTLFAVPGTIDHLMRQLSDVMPAQATQLLGDSLKRADSHPGSGIAVTLLGFAIAVWSVTGAMNSYMLAVNIAYGRADRRSFVSKRLVALEMAAVIGVAFLLVAVLTIFGPVLERSISSRAGDAGGLVSIAWW